MTCTLKETQVLYTSVVFFTCDGNLHLQKEENPFAAFVLLLQRFNECAIALKPANSLYYMLTQVLKQNFAAVVSEPTHFTTSTKQVLNQEGFWGSWRRLLYGVPSKAAQPPALCMQMVCGTL